jgi:transposase
VDGLQEAGYRVHLVNTSAVVQYEGLKHTDDRYDAFWLAHLMRLGLLPTGYIYPKAERGVRDLSRRRRQLVNHRTTHVLSIQNQVWRHTGLKLSCNAIKRLGAECPPGIDDANVAKAIGCNQAMLVALNAQIKSLEKSIVSQVKLRPEYALLLTIDGVGPILALTIMLEAGDIGRFPSVGDFSSYCRCVDSKRLSNGKKKGANNAKNGNKYLSWAFVEAAHFCRRFNPLANRFYQRKKAKHNTALATKALAHKLARASYYVLRDQVAFDPQRLFA